MNAISKSVRFYLDSRKKWAGDTIVTRPVVVSFSYQGKTFSTTTGFKISQSNWDGHLQRVKATVNRSDQVNLSLDILSERLNDIYFNGVSQGIEITNAYIFKQLRMDKAAIALSHRGFWEQYLDFLEIQKRIIKPSTWKSSKLSYTKFKEYCAASNKLEIKFDDITPGLLAYYTEYLIHIGNTNNTIHSHVKRLKRFLNYSKKMNLHKNETYKEFHLSQPLGPIKFLEMGEVKQLMNVQLDSSVEERSRDLLLFACFTGMRYSDIKVLKAADIKEHRFDGTQEVYHAAHIRQVKTSQETIVPLLPEALALIKKYEGSCRDFALPQLCLYTVNTVLKKVGEKAGLKALQKIEHFRGSIRETSYVEKWRVLTTHIGRRTFVTIAASKGMPINIVASITGQNPTTTMRHYMGVVSIDRFRELTSRVKFQ